MKSMTGYGRGEATHDGLVFRVELTSVNRKQSDIAINLPRDLNSLESKVRERVNGSVSRGRVNVSITCESATDGNAVLKVDAGLAAQYVEKFSALGGEMGQPLELEAADLIRAPGVVTLADSEISPDSAWTGVEEALDKALEDLVDARSREGTHLQQDLGERLAALSRETAAVRELAPTVVANYRTNLKKRLEESGLEVDLEDERIVREIGLFADRCDISEELTRLDSHFVQFPKYLESDDPVGRAMDFLSQEINRELNTIGSKANNAQIAQHIVNAKTELEKIREQVQNVE